VIFGRILVLNGNGVDLQSTDMARSGQDVNHSNRLCPQ
jgi:hypothetical protein